MKKTSYLYTRVPSSLIYILPMREYIMLNVLMEREGYLNRKEFGEWFSVPHIYICKALNVKHTSGSIKNLISQLRESLAEKDIIEFKLGCQKHAANYRIKWETIIQLAKYSSDFWINNSIECVQKPIENDEKTFQNSIENNEKNLQKITENSENSFLIRYHKTNKEIKNKEYNNNELNESNNEVKVIEVVNGVELPY